MKWFYWAILQKKIKAYTYPAKTIPKEWRGGNTLKKAIFTLIPKADNDITKKKKKEKK